jgi:hypothetical protein
MKFGSMTTFRQAQRPRFGRLFDKLNDRQRPRFDKHFFSAGVSTGSTIVMDQISTKGVSTSSTTVNGLQKSVKPANQYD